MISTKTRQVELDLLKLCALLSVICVHIVAEKWWIVPINTWQWQFFNVVRGTWAVPVFVMITGGFLLDPSRYVDHKKLGKYILRAISAFLIWSAFYRIYEILIVYSREDFRNINWKWEAVEFMKGEFHLWYLPMLVGLYLTIPFLRKICQDRDLMRWYILLFFLFESLSCYGILLPKIGVLFRPVIDNMNFHIAMGYTGYLIMGYYLVTEEISRKTQQMIYGFGLLCLIATPAVTSFYALWTGERTELFSNTLSPNLIISSAAIYVFFCKQVSRVRFSNRQSIVISNLAELGFGAYLIHAFFVNLLDDFTEMSYLTSNPVIWVPLLTILTFAVSILGAAMLRKIPRIGHYVA